MILDYCGSKQTCASRISMLHFLSLMVHFRILWRAWVLAKFWFLIFALCSHITFGESRIFIHIIILSSFRKLSNFYYGLFLLSYLQMHSYSWGVSSDVLVMLQIIFKSFSSFHISKFTIFVLRWTSLSTHGETWKWILYRSSAAIW